MLFKIIDSPLPANPLTLEDSFIIIERCFHTGIIKGTDNAAYKPALKKIIIYMLSEITPAKLIKNTVNNAYHNLVNNIATACSYDWELINKVLLRQLLDLLDYNNKNKSIIIDLINTNKNDYLITTTERACIADTLKDVLIIIGKRKSLNKKLRERNLAFIKNLSETSKDIYLDTNSMRILLKEFSPK